MSEQQLTRGILDAVNLAGLALVWRSQAGMLKVERRFVRMAPAGTPDILGYLLDGTGRMVAIEVKLPAGRVTALQAQWIRQANQAGSVAFVARSIPEALSGLRSASAQPKSGVPSGIPRLRKAIHYLKRA